MATGMIATGVIVRIRATGQEYGMHDACADALHSDLITAGCDPLSDDYPAVTIGPLFAPADEWTCAHTECATVRAAALSAETDVYVSPADMATPAPCAHWECALMGDTCCEAPAPAPACHVAGCEATPTHTDPATSAAGLAPYVCRAHYVPGVHVFAAPRVYDAMLTAYEYTLLIASGDLTRENALTAALTRDALLTDAERAERHAVSRDRYATRYHGTDWQTLTGRPA